MWTTNQYSFGSILTSKELPPDVWQEHLKSIFETNPQSVITYDFSFERGENDTTKFLIGQRVVLIDCEFTFNGAHISKLSFTLFGNFLDNWDIFFQALNFNIFFQEFDHALNNKFAQELFVSGWILHGFEDPIFDILLNHLDHLEPQLHLTHSHLIDLSALLNLDLYLNTLELLFELQLVVFLILLQELAVLICLLFLTSLLYLSNLALLILLNSLSKSSYSVIENLLRVYHHPFPFVGYLQITLHQYQLRKIKFNSSLIIYYSFMISDVPRMTRENPLYQSFPKYGIYFHIIIFMLIILGILTFVFADLKFIQSALLAVCLLITTYSLIKLKTMQFFYCYYIIKTRFLKVHQISYENEQQIKQNQQVQQFTHKNDQAQLSHYHQTFQQKSTPEPDVDRHYKQVKSAYTDQRRQNFKQNYGTKRFSKAVNYSEIDTQRKQRESCYSNSSDQSEKSKLTKGIPMQRLWSFNPKNEDNRSASGYSGITQRTNMHSIGRSMALFSQQSESYNYGDTIKSDQARQEYQKYKRKLNQLNFSDYSGFKDRIRSVQKNFIKQLSKNLKLQINNLEKIKQIFEQNFYVLIKQIGQQLKQPSQKLTLKRAQGISDFSQQEASIFDVIDKCMEKMFEKDKLSQITFIWDLKDGIGNYEKSQVIRTIRILMQDRLELDRYLSIKPSKYKIRCQRTKYLKKIKKIIQYYQKMEGKILQKGSEQVMFLPETPLILLNFLSITMKNATHRQIYQLLPKIDAPRKNQKTWIRFKQLHNVKFNHFTLIAKYPNNQVPQSFPCINGQLNFWCALYFYFYCLSQKFSTVLKGEPDIVQMLNVFLKK